MKVAIYNPGGSNQTRSVERLEKGGQRCVQYTAAYRVKIVLAADKIMIEERLTQQQASAAMQVSPSLISRWRVKSSALEQEARPNALSLNKGPVALLSAINKQLINFVDKWCGKGIPLSPLALIRKACSLSPGFSTKTLEAQQCCITCFMMKNGLTHRMATHTTQHPPGEVSDEAKGHLGVMVTITNNANSNPAFTLNMDQTPMWYTMEAKGTIEHQGACTVNIRTAMGDGKRVTVAVTITALGHQLPSMIVFKGKPNGRITKKEVPEAV
jgi:hypothetical protein